MIKKIIIDGDEVFMRKGFDGWRVVYPIKNEDGSLNLKNLILGGNIFQFIKIMIIPVALLIAVYFYRQDINSCQLAVKNITSLYSSFNSNIAIPNITLNIPYIVNG